MKLDGALYLFELDIIIEATSYSKDFGFEAMDVHGFGNDYLLGLKGLNHGVVDQYLAHELHNKDWSPKEIDADSFEVHYFSHSLEKRINPKSKEVSNYVHVFGILFMIVPFYIFT